MLIDSVTLHKKHMITLCIFKLPAGRFTLLTVEFVFLLINNFAMRHFYIKKGGNTNRRYKSAVSILPPFYHFDIISFLLQTRHRPIPSSALLKMSARSYFCFTPGIGTKPDFNNIGRSAIYTITETIVEVTALILVDATFHASTSSAAGLPRINNL